MDAKTCSVAFIPSDPSDLHRQDPSRYPGGPAIAICMHDASDVGAHSALSY